LLKYPVEREEFQENRIIILGFIWKTAELQS
jgi:hypothetical protein